MTGQAAGPAPPGGAYRLIERHLEGTIGADLAGHLSGRVAACVDSQVKRLGLSSALDLLAALQAGGERGQALLDELLAEVLVHETFFYRFGSQLEALELLVLGPKCEGRPGQPLRLWCAGCSRGPEAYTLAMVALRAALRSSAGSTLAPTLTPTPRPIPVPALGQEIRVLGTDLCGAFLDEARRATYPASRLRELPAELRDLFLVQLPEAGPQPWYAVSDRIRSLVGFQRHNLLDAPPGHNFDVISCRNVLMYLSPEARRTAIEHLASALAPRGLLLVGHSESLRDATDLLAPARRLGLGIYTLASAASAPAFPPLLPLPPLPPPAPPPPRARLGSPASASTSTGLRPEHEHEPDQGEAPPPPAPATIRLVGDYDEERFPGQLVQLKTRLGEVLDGGKEGCDVVLDADGATCLDQATATLISRAARALEARGGRLVVRATRPAVRRWAERNRLPLPPEREEETG